MARATTASTAFASSGKTVCYAAFPRAWPTGSPHGAGDTFKDISCPLSVFHKQCLAKVPRFDALHRYLPYLIQAQGYDVAELPVRHFPRVAEKTKYGISNRLWLE